MEKNEEKTTPEGTSPEQKTEASAPEGTSPEQKTAEQLQSEIDALRAAQEANNATLEAVFNDLAAKVPEQYRSLIPQGSFAERLRWLQSATDAGLFVQHAKQNSPGHTRPMPQGVDLNDLTPHAILSNAYAQK